MPVEYSSPTVVTGYSIYEFSDMKNGDVFTISLPASLTNMIRPRDTIRLSFEETDICETVATIISMYDTFERYDETPSIPTHDDYGLLADMMFIEIRMVEGCA